LSCGGWETARVAFEEEIKALDGCGYDVTLCLSTTMRCRRDGMLQTFNKALKRGAWAQMAQDGGSKGGDALATGRSSKSLGISRDEKQIESTIR
jgi:hypothetical protein